MLNSNILGGDVVAVIA